MHALKLPSRSMTRKTKTRYDDEGCGGLGWKRNPIVLVKACYGANQKRRWKQCCFEIDWQSQMRGNCGHCCDRFGCCLSFGVGCYWSLLMRLSLKHLDACREHGEGD